MKKKGFTLIELLAVIIILAVIALIATPLVLDVVSSAEEESRIQTVNGYIEATRMYITESILKDTSLEGNLYDIIKDRVKGQRPETGEILVGENNKIAVALKLDGRCYIKGYDDISPAKSENEECTVANEVASVCFGKEVQGLESYDINVANCVPYFTEMLASMNDGSLDINGFCNRTATIFGIGVDQAITEDTASMDSLIELSVIENVKFTTKCDSCFQIDVIIDSYDINYTKCKEMFLGASSEELELICTGETLSDGTSIDSFLEDPNFKSQLMQFGVIENMDFDGVSITDYKCFENNNYDMPVYTDIAIPYKINGEPVLNISYYAFSGNDLTSVDFSQAKKLKDIKSYAFSYNNLSVIKIHDLPELATIEYAAFDGNNLSSLDFKNLPSLKQLAGFSQTGLTTFDIKPEEVPNLTRIIDFSSNSIKKLDLSGFTKLTDIEGFSGNPIEELILPKSIVTIEDYAFYGTNIKNLELVDLPNLETIGFRAFADVQMDTLKMENLPKLEEIQTYAFSENNLKHLDLSKVPSLTHVDGFTDNKIEQIIFSTETETISQEAFENNNLKELDLTYLPKLRQIGAIAFQNNQIETLNLNGLTQLEYIYGFENNNLTTLDLSGVENLIEVGGFSNNQLEQITLPSNLQVVVTNAFRNNRLKQVNFSDFGKVYKIATGAFQNNQIESVNLANSEHLQAIETGAFKNNKITSIQLPSGNVNPVSIYSNAFSNNLLEEIVIPLHVNTINSNAFSSSNTTETVTFTNADETTYTIDYLNNPNLSKIVNKSGLSFDWNSIILGQTTNAFETGTVTTINGTVTITNE